MVTDYFSENADAVVCGAGYTWSDGRHYTVDTGYFWWSDPDDSDHYSYANLNFNTAPYYIDSTTNAGCGTLHMLGIAVDNTVPGVTVTFIKYYQENATSLDTLYAMTASVCEDVPYIVPDMPDSVTREGYRFDHWTDNPACGWTVDPGEEKDLYSDYLVFYGVWESTCSDVTVADTMTLCPNDTVDWHGNTWIGQQYTAGEEYDEPIQHYDVIPGECDSIFLLHLKVPNELYVSTMPSGSSTYCMNQQAVQIELPISGGGDYTCEWYKDGVAVTDHNPGDASNKYTPSTATAGSYTLSAKVVAECGSDSVEVQIVTVYDILAATSASSDTTYCQGGNAEALSVGIDGGSGSLTYQWYVNGTEIADASNSAYTPNTGTAGTFVYSVKVTDGMCGDIDSIAVATITVQPGITLELLNDDTSYCFGATAQPITINATGGTGEYHYSWLVANNSDFMMGETWDMDTNKYTPATDANRSYYFRVTVTSGACSTQEDINGIYVMEPIVLSLTADTNSMCLDTEGSDYDVEDFTEGGAGNYTYQWYRNGTELTGETGSNYMPVGDAVGTFVYSVVATDQAGCHSDTTNVAVLTVNARIAAASASIDTGYCHNATADSLRVTVTGGSGNYSYRWFVHNYYEDVLSTDSAYKPATNEPGTTLYDIEVSDNECDGDTSFTVATITVYEDFAWTPDASDATYCYGATVAPLSITATGAGDSYSYQWYIAGQDTNYIIEGATSRAYAPPTDSSAIGTTSYYVQVESNVCSGSGNGIVADITVYAPFVVTVSNQDTTYCPWSNANPLTVNVTGGGSTYAYGWYKDYSNIQGAEDATYTPSTSDAGEAFYSVAITEQSGCGDTLVSVATITVQDIQLTTFVDTTYCYGATAEAITLSPTGGNGEYSYLWVVANHDDMIPADTLATTTNVCVPITDSAASYYYRVTITSGACSTERDVARIYVMEPVRINLTPDTSTICFGSEGTTYELTDYTDGGYYGDYTYQWYKNGEVLTGEEGDTYMPVGTTSGTFVYSAVATDEAGCHSDTTTVGVLTVYNEITAPTASTDTAYYCYGSPIPQLTSGITGGSGRFYYYWYLEGEMLDEHGATLTPDLAAGIYQYSVSIMDSAGCDGTAQTFQPIRIKLSSSTFDTITVCDSLRWINDSIYAIDYVAGGSDRYQGFTTDQIDTVADQYGCDSIVYLHLTVNPSGYLYNGRGGLAPDTMTYCYNSPLGLYSESQSPDYFTYQWYKDGEVLTDATWWMDTTSLADTPGTHVYSLKVTPYSGCASDSGAVRVATIYEPFVVTSMQMDTAGCMEDTYLHLPFIDTNATGGSGNIFSNWYEIVGNDTIESNTVYMDSVGPGEYNFVMKETDTYGCGEGIAIYTTVTVAENYIASFVSNEDNSTTMSDIRVCAIKELVMPENEYTYPNYNFVGWGTATAADTLQPGDTVVITGNVTYYTLWEFVCQDIDTTEIARICEGSTTTWRGYTVDGTVEAYVDTVTGVVNELCDSIYHLLVEVGTPNEHDTTLTVCDSLTWNGTLYTETPDTTLVYVLADGNMYGCDSTDKLTLTVIYSGHEYEVVTACDSYTMDNTIYTESTDLPTITGEMPNGCPFYTHMSLTIHHSYYGDTSVTACVEYTWNDMTMRESGEQEFRGQTIEGCDSIVMLDLTINPATYGVDEQVVCDSLTWLDGNTYYDGFEADFNFITYTFEGANQYGCDSIVALGITMMEHIDVAFQSDYGDGWMDPTQTCENTPMVVPDCDYENPGYRFGGWLDVETGDTIQPGDTVTMENGRSYIAIWIPICNDAYVVTDTVMCTGDSLLWCGQLMAGDDLVSGSYEHVAYDVIENACDSIYMLRLTVYPTGHAEYYDTVHGEYMWNGEIYSTTGDYTVWVGRNRWGCDSLETLHLVVNLGIDDSDLDNMKLYPNPTRGDVNIEGVEVKKVEVLDMVGRTVATFEGSNHIDITDLPSGTYTLAITTMDDRLVTRRVAKR